MKERIQAAVFLSIMMILALAAASQCGGCTRYQKFIMDPTARQLAATDFGDAIRIALIATDPSDAKDEAARITRISQKIKEVMNSDIMVSDVRVLIANRVVNLLDKEDQPRARIIAELLASRIKARFNVDLAVVPAEAFPLTRAFVIQLCDEAISAAAPYTL